MKDLLVLQLVLCLALFKVADGARTLHVVCAVLVFTAVGQLCDSMLHIKCGTAANSLSSIRIWVLT